MKFLKYFESEIYHYDKAWEILPQEDKDVFKFKIGDIVKFGTKLYKIISLDTDPVNMRSGGTYGITELENSTSKWKVCGNYIKLATDYEIDALKYNL